MRKRLWLLHLVRVFFFVLGFAIGPALSTFLFEPSAGDRPSRSRPGSSIVGPAEPTEMRAMLSEGREELAPVPSRDQDESCGSSFSGSISPSDADTPPPLGASP